MWGVLKGSAAGVHVLGMGSGHSKTKWQNVVVRVRVVCVCAWCACARGVRVRVRVCASRPGAWTLGQQRTNMLSKRRSIKRDR